MTTKNADAALANADSHTTYASGMCLQFVRGPCWGVGSFYVSAIDAWHGARHQHPGDRYPPQSAPLFFEGGQYGHAVIARGNDDRMRSTDCTSTGMVSNAAIGWIESHWGYRYLGWTEDLNGVDLPLEGSDMELTDPIAEWSPDDGGGGQTTVGKTLNQARGYAEDAYQRVKKLQDDVDRLENKVDKILNRIGGGG